MKSINLAIIVLLFAFSLRVSADVDVSSIFEEARYPVSELDLRLTTLQQSWWQQYVRNPDEKTKRRRPLITKAGLGVDLRYLGDDYITADCYITKLDGFLRLSIRDRKRLVSNALEQLIKNLLLSVKVVDKQTGSSSGKILLRKHIKLSIVMNDVFKNKRNENIRLFLPMNIGVGQAGFKDGQYVFSNPYYLNLKVIDDLAVSGDPKKFTFERK